jgi:peroxiredoxin Q/BCP
VQLQESLGDLERAGIRLVAISYDSEETLREFAEGHDIGYLLLSDPGGRTIEAWGIRNEKATGRTRGIPHPGFFLVDGSGTVRAKLFRDGYKARPPPEEIIEAAKPLR